MADFSAAVRFRDWDFACLASAVCDAAEWPSRWSALVMALERFTLGRLPRRMLPGCEILVDRVRFDFVPVFGGGTSTPARRALDRPMAMACFVDRAPCLPSRM